MSWHLTLTCWDHELDGKIKALVASQSALKDNPASARALQRVQEHVLASLNHQPFGARFVVQSSGHYDSVGEGSHTVSVRVVTKEQAEKTDRTLADASAPPVAPLAPVGAGTTPPTVTVPSATGVGVDAPPAPTDDNTTHPTIDPNLEDVPTAGA
jgi:hypothetical protein